MSMQPVAPHHTCLQLRTCVGTLQLLMHIEAHPDCSRYLQRSTSTPMPSPTCTAPRATREQHTTPAASCATAFTLWASLVAQTAARRSYVRQRTPLTPTSHLHSFLQRQTEHRKPASTAQCFSPSPVHRPAPRRSLCTAPSTTGR